MLPLSFVFRRRVSNEMIATLGVITQDVRKETDVIEKHMVDCTTWMTIAVLLIGGTTPRQSNPSGKLMRDFCFALFCSDVLRSVLTVLC